MQELYAGYGWALDIAIAGNEPGDRFLFTFRHHGHVSTFGPLTPKGGLVSVRLSGSETQNLQVGSHSGELVLLRGDGAAVIPLDTQFVVHKAGTPPRLAGENPQPLMASNGTPFTIMPESSPGITLSIQRSIAGPAGLSAYEVALANGYIGTEAEWLNSLGGAGLQSRIAALEVMMADLTDGSVVTPTGPTFVTAPTLTPSSGDLGTVFTVTTGSAIAYPEAVLNGALTLNGLDVTAEIAGSSYVANATGTLVWTVTATNVMGSASQSTESLVRIGSYAAPSFTAAPSIVPDSGDVGTVFTVSDGALTGYPAPTLTRTLTLDGVDVTADLSGSTYVSSAAGRLSYAVTATNEEGFATASADSTVTAADTRTPPIFATAPTLTPSSGVVGTVFTLSLGAAVGDPAPSLSGALTLNGLDVTAELSGTSYTATTAGTLEWTVTASNSEGVETASASSVVTAINTLTPPSFTTLPTVTPSSGEVGTVFTLSLGTAAGDPAPAVSGALTLDGVDVTGEMSGSTYIATEAGTLVWTVTATNSQGTETTSATTGVTSASTLSPPIFAAQPTLTPSSGEVGTVFTISLGSASGEPAPSLSGVLTLNGVDVTADIVGTSYTSTAAGTLVWTVTADNSEGTETASTTGTVTVAGTAPVFTTMPSIVPSNATVGTELALSEGLVSGTPTPVLTPALTLDGMDVTAQIAGGSYTPTTAGVLNYTVTAANTEGTAEGTATAMITAGGIQVRDVPNLFTAAQSNFLDTSHVDGRGNWSIVGNTIVQDVGNGSHNDVRLNFDTRLVAGRPYLMKWSTIPATSPDGFYKPLLGGAGSITGNNIAPDDTAPKYWWVPSAGGNYTRAGFDPVSSAANSDITITGVEVHDISSTDPRAVACDVVLVLGDSLLANASSDFATEANTAGLTFDPQLWYIPSLAIGSPSFDNTFSARHVPQPVFEPVQCAGGAARITPIHACGLELVNWSVARSRPILFLALAEAGSGLNGNEGQQWRHPEDTVPDGDGNVVEQAATAWNEMVLMKAALEALGPAHDVVGAIVSLGSNDRGSSDYTQVWEPVAVNWVSRLRTLWGKPNLPIAWLGANPDQEDGSPPDYKDLPGLPYWTGRMRTSQANLDQDSGSQNAIPGVKFVPGVSGYSYTGSGKHIPDAGGKVDELHYNAAGQIINGRNLGQGLLSLLPPAS